MVSKTCGINYDKVFISGKYINAINGEVVEIYNYNSMEKLNYENIIALNETVNEKYSIAITIEEKYKILENNELQNNEYDYLEYLQEDKFIAYKNNKFGIISANGNSVVNFKYDYLQKMFAKELLQGVIKSNENILYEYLDFNGNVTENVSLNELYLENIGEYIKQDLGYGQPYYLKKEI